MKTTGFLVLFIIFSSGTCKPKLPKEDTGSKSITSQTEMKVEIESNKFESDDLLDKQWLLVEMENLETDLTKEIWIRFESGDDHRFVGFSSCNNFFGNYELDGSTINFSDLASTKKLCPEIKLEDLFFKNLSNTKKIELINVNLILLDQQGDRMVFEESEIGVKR